MKLFPALVMIALLAPAAAAAATEKNVGSFGNWSVWKYQDGARKGCFIYATPTSMKPKKLDHGLVSFFIRSTRRTNVRTEASLQVGYAQKTNADATAVVGNKTFHLMIQQTGAWLAKAREKELLREMKHGRSMTVSTVSRRGNKTRYEFPLAGVTQAMQLLRKHCP